MSSEAENKRENCSSGKDVLERTWTIHKYSEMEKPFAKKNVTPERENYIYGIM
jgi:hypothetical protein